LNEVGFKSRGDNVSIAENAVIHGAENISLGSNIRIDSFVTIIATGPITIGSYVHIGSYCLLSGGSGIVMEDFSGLSQGVKLYSRSDDYSGEYLTNPCVPASYTNVSSGQITLGKHVMIGSGSVILPGVTIEEGCSVGALSMMHKSVPGWGVYFGSPARRVGERSKRLLELEQCLKAERAA
jgi:acetyltransferase-like isoleucine patch superfamily enzyme